MNPSVLRLSLSLLPLAFLSFQGVDDGFDGDEEGFDGLDEPNCAGCQTGVPLLEASHIKVTGESITITVEASDGDCFSAFNPPAHWGCQPSGCNFEISRTWSGMESGTPIENCWGWENPRSGVELTRNCDVATPGPVVDVTGTGSSFTTEQARCQDNGYYWDLKIGDLSVEVGTTCSSCIIVGD